MKNKRKNIITFIIILIILIAVGGVFAYLTSTDSKTNIFTLGKVKIELTESNFVEANAQDVRPGDQIAKDPKITNIGRNSAYVYIKVVNPIVNLSNGEGPLFSYTVNSGWTQLDEVEQCGYKATTYYYNTALNPNASTPTLFNTVTLNNYSNDSDPNQVLDLYGYAIQSSYLASGSTITSIFSSTFKSNLSDTTEECNSSTDCSNNTSYTTIPSNLKGLAKIMAKNAYLDNGRSEYVSSCSGVDFSAVSSDTNGKGIYEIASTKNNPYPIYYYRGAVDNNNVKFGGFCWKAIRSTDTGGVKMIYNGEPDGSGNCTNTTGTNTQIGTSKFNTNRNSVVYAGYMYGIVYSYSSKTTSDMNISYVYGNDVTYSGGTYTLTNTMTSTGTWSNDYNTLNNYHYTCFTTGTTCSSVYYLYYTNSSTGTRYITLTGGKKVGDALDEMFNASNLNTTESTIKTQIDNWYNTNLSNFNSYIEDTIYCNDRSIIEFNGWEPNGYSHNTQLKFGPQKRLSSTHIPSLVCNRALDKFTVSSFIGNGALTYPVGLLTSDEVMYAGGKENKNNSTYYLYTNQRYWTLSPNYFYNGYVNHNIFVDSNGNIGYFDINYSYGVRPVISLKSTDIVESGDGTSTNPYVIKTN